MSETCVFYGSAATELVYKAAGTPEVEGAEIRGGRCALCKQPLKNRRAVPVEDAVKPTFTNRDLLDVDAGYVCVACAYCLSEPLLRRRDFLATQTEITYLKRDELLPLLLEPPEPPFVLCVGLSHKKHLVIRTRVNLSRRLFYVQFEEQGIWVQPEKHRSLALSVQALLKGFGKSQISSGEYFVAAKFDPSELLRLEAIIRPYRGTGIFNLLLYASRSPLREKRNVEEKENGNGKT